MQQSTSKSIALTGAAGLFFLQMMAMGAWFVPLGPILDAHDLQKIKPYAFAVSATAAFVSPLLFGAIADRHVVPSRVLRWLSFATAGAMALTGWAIHSGAPWWVVLLCDQLQALCSAPTWGLVASIVLSRLTNASRQFGPVRAFGTVGWIIGCWVISAMRADTSPVAMFVAAGIWIVVALYTYLLPTPAPPQTEGPTTIRARLGLDALGLLRDPNHRIVFVTAALFAMPLAAFYPYAPTHLRDLGLERTAAWMSLGQVSEILAMVLLAGILARFPFKWTFAAGLGFGLLRYVLCMLDGAGWVLAGISLHGMAFTLFFITAQIYLEQRIEPAWRARAQALLTVMMTGVGNLFGYLGTGWWFFKNQQNGTANWPTFWGGLAVAVAVVLFLFLAAYRRRSQH